MSVALRNLVLFLGSVDHDGGDQPEAFAASCIAAIPVIVLPLVGVRPLVRRRSRTAQDTLADASAYAAELIGAMRTLQAFTNERLAQSRFGARGRARLRGGARNRRARARC